MKSNLDRGYFPEPESPAPRWTPRATATAVAVAVLCAVAGSVTYCRWVDETNPSTFSAGESASRIWQLLDSGKASTSEIRGHAMNICAKAEQAIADLAIIADRADEPLRGQICELMDRIQQKAQDAVDAPKKRK